MILDVRDGYEIDDDKARLDRDVIHGVLGQSYWAAGIPRAVIEKSIDGSDCFGVYQGSQQIGFARLVTDRATFAYLCDVFILPEFRGQGLAKWLCGSLIELPRYQGLRRWLLATRDAHEVYRPIGFSPLADPAKFMEINDREVYKSSR